MNRLCGFTLLASALLAGCPKPAEKKEEPAATTPDAGPPDAGPPVRTVEEDHPLLGTTPTGNLVWDPLLQDTQAAFGFYGITVRTGMDLAQRENLAAPTPSGTPALAVIPGQRAHSVAIATFPGGTGPMHAEVWVRGDSGENIVVAPTDIQVQVGEAWIEVNHGSAVFDLLHVEADDVMLGDSRWHHFVGNIPGDLPLLNVFVVTCTRRDATLVMAGPVVVPDPLLMHARPGAPGVQLALQAHAQPATEAFNAVRQTASSLYKAAVDRAQKPR